MESLSSSIFKIGIPSFAKCRSASTPNCFASWKISSRVMYTGMFPKKEQAGVSQMNWWAQRDLVTLDDLAKDENFLIRKCAVEGKFER